MKVKETDSFFLINTCLIMSAYIERLKVVAKMNVRKNLLREYERQIVKVTSSLENVNDEEWNKLISTFSKLMTFIREIKVELKTLTSEEAKLQLEITQIELNQENS